MNHIYSLTAVALTAGCPLVVSVHARDTGQWAAASVHVHDWFETLTQPDNSTASCCGEADAYEADSFEVDGNRYVAIITDGRGDFPTGTRISVPNTKMKWDSGNPTGHGIIFLGTDARVVCYVPPGGI